MQDTYAGAGEEWDERLNKAIDGVGISKLGVGMETIDPNTGNPLSEELLTWRFSETLRIGANEIDIWDTPIPDDWIPLLVAFVFADTPEEMEDMMRGKKFENFLE